MDSTTSRSAQEVFEDHLRQGKHGSVEDDLARNYAEDVVVLCSHGVYWGHEGVRHVAQILRDELPDATFEYRTRLVEGEVAFLEWTARSENAKVEDGADSFCIETAASSHRPSTIPSSRCDEPPDVAEAVRTTVMGWEIPALNLSAGILQPPNLPSEYRYDDGPAEKKRQQDDNPQRRSELLIRSTGGLRRSPLQPPRGILIGIFVSRLFPCSFSLPASVTA